MPTSPYLDISWFDRIFSQTESKHADPKRIFESKGSGFLDELRLAKLVEPGLAIFAGPEQ